MVRLLGYFCCALFLLIISLSCDSSEPPPTVPPPPDLRKITLSVEDVSCTEVWLNIKADSLTFPSEIILLKDTVAQTISLCCSDTTLYIDSLLPNKPYNYKAILTVDTTIKSETVTAQTLDTTSHNFSWQSWTFGEHSSSSLSDVAIIDENNIWAVGEIYMNDSLGNPDPNAYNAAHWDGSQWELKRIMFPTVCGSTNRTSYPAKSIFVFQDGEIWIGSSGDKIAILENNIQVNEFCLPTSLNMGINKIWGTSSEDLYVVGNEGNIAHYENGVWTKIESGTDLNINDIWGEVNPQTGEYEILCIASHISFNEGNKLLKVLDNSTTEINNEGLPWSLFTLWFKPGRTYYVGGDGMYNLKQLGESWTKDLSLPPYYKTSIRGQALNDIVLCGVYGLLMHNNGVEWKNYQYTVFEPDKTFANIDIKENVVSASGSFGSKAFVTIGVRE
ncbi:MAG: glucosyl transferase [Ignavibacteriales bacterium]|nr:glucosyl transferase [Ignavibacteriales bacterium]